MKRDRNSNSLPNINAKGSANKNLDSSQISQDVNNTLDQTQFTGVNQTRDNEVLSPTSTSIMSKVNDYKTIGTRQFSQSKINESCISAKYMDESRFSNRFKLLTQDEKWDFERPKKIMNAIELPQISRCAFLEKQFLKEQTEMILAEVPIEAESDNEYVDYNNDLDEVEIHRPDKKEHKRIGIDAIQNFYKHNLILNKVLQQNRYFKDVTDSAITNILNFSNKKLLLPCKMGVVKYTGEPDVLNIKNNRYGDKYAKVLSKSLPELQDVMNYNFSGNRLGQKGAENLLANISKKARILELQDNNIGYLGSDLLRKQLISRDCLIEILNLENNTLGDENVKLVLKALKDNSSIRHLNLSKNFLTDNIAYDLKQVLEKDKLVELYLHWNKIKAPGGKEIFTGLIDSEALKVLDISCNNIGVPSKFEYDNVEPCSSCAEDVAAFLIKNKDVRHLDLGTNYFNETDSRIISEALNKNRTIYGFHFEGNVGYVDSRGFLVIPEVTDQTTGYNKPGIHCKSRINGLQCQKKKKIRLQRDRDIEDICWICDGWAEKHFTWNPEEHGDMTLDPFFVHLSYEDFRHCYTGLPQNNQVATKIMVPPGELQFFFSNNDGAFSSPQYDVVVNPEGTQLNDIEFYNEIKNVEIENINIQKIDRNNFVMKPDGEPNVTCLPRTKEIYNPPDKIKLKKQWKFPISIWHKMRYINDSPQLLERCFEFDWTHNEKIANKIKDEAQLAESKKLLKFLYKDIKNMYKHFASLNPVDEIWAIQEGSFRLLQEEIKICDPNNEELQEAKIYIRYKEVIAGSSKGNPRDPRQAVTRYQMMEWVVRVAEMKYIKIHKVATTFPEAIQMFYDEHMKEKAPSWDEGNWRESRYWNKDCDLCLKYYQKILDNIYKQNSSRNVKPGQQKFMCLSELQSIVKDSGIAETDHCFTTETRTTAFNSAMMTREDEINRDDIFQMHEVEFYEAIARIAEDASVPNQLYYTGKEDWTQDEKKKQPLAYKLEAYMVQFLIPLCDKGLQNLKYDKSYFHKSEYVDEWD